MPERMNKRTNVWKLKSQVKAGPSWVRQISNGVLIIFIFIKEVFIIYRLESRGRNKVLPFNYTSSTHSTPNQIVDNQILNCALPAMSGQIL